MSNIRPVILAGGQGTRFWPISRASKPKQFLSISKSGESLIQATVKRLEPLAPRQEILIVTNEKHADLVNQHVPGCAVICEPVAKNTAASIGLAAIHLIKTHPNSVMAVFPADHYVANPDLLTQKIALAAQIAAKQNVLITVGITPTSPNTAYGYVNRGEEVSPGVYAVNRFYEKPSLERAKKYLEDREFYWNAGIFVWRPEVFLEGLKGYMTDLYSGLMEISSHIGTKQEVEVVSRVFSSLDSVSVDFGLLEHSRNCVVVESGDIGWNDVGSWDAWANHFTPDEHKNLLHGETVVIDSNSCVVYSADRLIALLGCEDLVVIDSKDALLVCPRSRVQDVKEVVTELTMAGKSKLV